VTYRPNIFSGNLKDIQDWDSEESGLPAWALLTAWIGTAVAAGIAVAVYMRAKKRKAPPVGSSPEG